MKSPTNPPAFKRLPLNIATGLMLLALTASSGCTSTTSATSKKIIFRDGNALIRIDADKQGRVTEASIRGWNLLKEERLWLAPEAGPFSLFHDQIENQTRSNYRAPKSLVHSPVDACRFSHTTGGQYETATLSYTMDVTNASGTIINVGLERTLHMTSLDDAELLFNAALPHNVKYVGYVSENRLTNQGDAALTKESGTVALWPISSFEASDETVVIAPYNRDGDGSEVHSGYLGEPGSDRLVIDSEHGVILFRADGKSLGKIGLNKSRNQDKIGAIDFIRNVLVIVSYDDTHKAQYVNSRPLQTPDDAFDGDVIYAYNHSGADGEHYYNLETTGPAAFLEPGQSIAHHHRTFCFQADLKTLSQISEKILGISLNDVKRQMSN